MKLGFSQQEIIDTAKTLGLPTDGFIQRRVARAFDLVETNKVSKIDDGIFRVRSQYEPDKSYIVNLNHGEPSCDCPDSERTIHCKHRIAALLFSHQQAIAIIKTTDGGDGDYWRRCWLIAQGNKRTVVYDERDRRLFCNCGAYYNDCEHKRLVIEAVKHELKQKRIVNECGSQEALELQNKLNGQPDSQNNNGNGAHKAPSQTMKLDLRDPFQQSEQLDIDQIEGRLNGELVHKLSNGEYVISYKGIMTLSEKHGIEFSEAVQDDTHTVIAKGRCGTSERVSGKPINGNANTALELAKRNAARQLLPYAEIKAIEKKAKLNAEFDWQKANAKCVELVGEANVDIIIHELVNAGKLRQDNPSHYDRTEWLIIYNACKQDNNDGGDKTPSSDDTGWRDWYDKCVKVSSIAETDIAIKRVMNDHNARYRKDLISDDNWQRIFEIAKELRDDYNRVQAAKSERAFLTKQYEYDYIQAKTGFNVRRKQIAKIFGRTNGATKKLSKLYDEKPLEFEIDTTKPNVVKLIFSNGTVATVYDQVIYESVKRA